MAAKVFGEFSTNEKMKDFCIEKKHASMNFLTTWYHFLLHIFSTRASIIWNASIHGHEFSGPYMRTSLPKVQVPLQGLLVTLNQSNTTIEVMR